MYAMKIFLYAFAICFTLSLLAKCPEMRKASSKAKNVIPTTKGVTPAKLPKQEKVVAQERAVAQERVVVPERAVMPLRIYNTIDSDIYKYSVNESKFRDLQTARKYMMVLQKEAKKEGRKVEVIKVDNFAYKVISKQKAEDEYSKLLSPE
jgi:hypothetical protein